MPDSQAGFWVPSGVDEQKFWVAFWLVEPVVQFLSLVGDPDAVTSMSQRTAIMFRAVMPPPCLGLLGIGGLALW